MEKFGLGGNSKGLMANGKAEDPEESDEELDGPEITEFRAAAARLNFVAQDSPDIHFATKEVCREMSEPTRSSWVRLKRLARYLLVRVTAVLRFEWLYEEPGFVHGQRLGRMPADETFDFRGGRDARTALH